MNCDLQRHIAKTHNKEDLSVMCQHCGQVMQDARALMRHVYRHHNKRKMVFPCRFCPKEFKTREARNKHVRIHSKTKPHKCKLCDYRSYSRYNVWLHIKSVHKDLEPSYSLMVQEGDFEYDEDKGNGKVPYEVPASKSTPDINSEENE